MAGVEKKMRHCPICGSLFIDTGGGACSDCAEKLSEMKDRIMEYLEEHPNAKLVEISKNTSVSEELVKRLFESGSFTVSCARCGAPIMEGKYCRGCLEKLRKGLDGMMVRQQERKEVKVREKKRGSRMEFFK